MADDLSPMIHQLAAFIRVAKRTLKRLEPYLVTTDTRPPGVDEDFKEMIHIADTIILMGEGSDWLLMGNVFEAWFHEKVTSMNDWLARAAAAWPEEISSIKLQNAAPMTEREWLHGNIVDGLRESLRYAETLFKESARDVPAWEG
jgi:hypothetical protein